MNYLAVSQQQLHENVYERYVNRTAIRSRLRYLYEITAFYTDYDAHTNTYEQPARLYFRSSCLTLVVISSSHMR